MWLAVVVMISLIISLVFRVKHDVKYRGNKRIEKAKSFGHMVKAKCINKLGRRKKSNGRMYWTGRYVYEVDGKKYERLIANNDCSVINVGDTITLYWIDNPKKLLQKQERAV